MLDTLAKDSFDPQKNKENNTHTQKREHARGGGRPANDGAETQTNTHKINK
jgi:hypothetical protein